MNKAIVCLTLSLFVAANTALALDPALRKGPMSEGSVEALTDTGLTLKTTAGTLAVAITTETKVLFGMEGPAAAAKDIRTGDYLMVYGHKLETGELAATEIMIHRKQQSGPPAANAAQEPPMQMNMGTAGHDMQHMKH
jgi:hypothetical protein